MSGQRGFMIIEILMAMAIAGMIMPVIATSMFQISRGTITMNNDFVIQQDIDVASNWFNRDLSQAVTTNLANEGTIILDDAGVTNLRVDWIDLTGWATQGSEGHYVEYTLSGTNLIRNYDGTSTIAARRISDIQFSRSGRFITVIVKSSLSPNPPKEGVGSVS